MNLSEAKRRCPDLRTVGYEFPRYTAAAEAMYKEVFSVTPYVIGLSCDEAVMDVTEACYREEAPGGVGGHMPAGEGGGGGRGGPVAAALAERLRAKVFEATG